MINDLTEKEKACHKLLTRGTSGYSSLLGNLCMCVCVCVCVCVSGQAESTPSVQTLQNQYTWASYDTLEKTIILSFAEKALVKRKGLQTLRQSHRAVSTRGLMRLKFEASHIW